MCFRLYFSAPTFRHALKSNVTLAARKMDAHFRQGEHGDANFYRPADTMPYLSKIRFEWCLPSSANVSRTAT